MLKPMTLGKSYNVHADDAVFLHIHALPRPQGSARDVTAVPDRRDQLAKLQKFVDDSKHLPQPFQQYLARLLHKPTQPDLKQLMRTSIAGRCVPIYKVRDDAIAELSLS